MLVVVLKAGRLARAVCFRFLDVVRLARLDDGLRVHLLRAAQLRAIDLRIDVNYERTDRERAAIIRVFAEIRMPHVPFLPSPPSSLHFASLIDGILAYTVMYTLKLLILAKL